MAAGEFPLEKGAAVSRQGREAAWGLSYEFRKALPWSPVWVPFVGSSLRVSLDNPRVFGASPFAKGECFAAWQADFDP